MWEKNNRFISFFGEDFSKDVEELKKASKILNGSFDSLFSSLEVEDDNDKTVYRFNIAGTKKQDIKIEVIDNVLVLSIKDKIHSRKGVKFNYVEASATYEDGILSIVFIKNKTSKIIKIE